MEMLFGQLYYRPMIRSLLTVILSLASFVASAEAVAPAYVLQLPESVSTVLIAETATATLHRYEADGDMPVISDSQRMSIGKNGAGKVRSGDQRTPLGIYFVVAELDTTNLHEKYGAAAFPLDYPNAWDETRRRTGHGIWIHGVAPGSGDRPELDTDGCIALPNEHLLSLKPYLEPLQVPVIVTREIRASSDEKASEARTQLLAAIQRWADSYRGGDWHSYLSMYADDFVYRDMTRDEWVAYRLKTLGARAIGDYVLDEVLLIADPEEEGLYLSRFRQTITESGHTLVTTKRLYWRKTAAGDLKIVAEDNG